MGIRFTPKFSVHDIRRMIERRVAVIENASVDQLKQIGELFIIDARSTRTYTDRTGNLRHSIGYLILKDGEQIFGNFQEAGTGKNKEPLVGSENGHKLALEVGKEHSTGYVLIVVAGMNYAAYVEAKGFDVITASGLTAEANLKRAIARLQERIKKMK